MDNLTTIILIAWFICAIISLAKSDSAVDWIGRMILDALLCGFIYVVLHFVIKYW